MVERNFDIVCLGRGAVDLYGEQIGSRLEDMQTFAKYVGGSSLNIATGCARQGLKAAMLLRVGDEHMGRFVRETLASEGVDVSHVITDPQRLTALAILGIKDRETFPLIFYRENCADMNLQIEDFGPDFIAQAKALLITGTHFSTPHINQVSRRAIEYARAAGTKVVVDIDYRPVLWGLTGHGLGEERFVESRSVTEHLQSIIPLCDLIVGTEEEVHIAGGRTDTVQALRNMRALSDAVLVCKRGALGASVFTGAIPDDLEQGISVAGVKVEVLNAVGAGDAFMSGFLRGWIHNDGYEQCLRYANACGALVVSRHGCTPAMPTKAELDDYLARAEQVPRPDLDTRLNYLHRVTVRHRHWPEVLALAFDHRSQLEDMARANKADPARIPRLKSLIAAAFERAAAAAGAEGSAGVLVDDRYGQAVLETLTGGGWWIARPVELPGSRPLRFEHGDDVGLIIRSWPAEQVVKCLVYYHPDDDDALRKTQEAKLVQLFAACEATQHDLLLEVISPPGMPRDETTLARGITRFYDLGVYPGWWKLPPPSRAAWRRINRVIQNRDPYCRGVLLLGLDAPEEEIKRGFDIAADQALCKGFAVGRSIFGAPAKAWFRGDTGDADAIAAIAANYQRIIELWRQRKSCKAV